jgi:ribosomal protein S18 acetylase RimI-like enzyme
MAGNQADGQSGSESTVNVVIEEVNDVIVAWPELEPLLLGILEYHQPYDPRKLRLDWAQRWREYLAAGPGLFLLARNRDGLAVAFLNGRVSKDGGIFDEVSAYVDNAFVNAPERSRGICHAMLRHFEQWSRDQGATVVRLNVASGNELGRDFWMGAGFSISGLAMEKTLGTKK